MHGGRLGGKRLFVAVWNRGQRLAAPARIHRCEQLKSCRKQEAGVGAHELYLALFEGLAQRLEGAALKLG